jgi:hypothetical protein
MSPIDKNSPANGSVKSNEPGDQSKEQSPLLENELGTGRYDGEKSKNAPEPSHNADKKDELTDSLDNAAIDQEKLKDNKPETDIDYDNLFMV